MKILLNILLVFLFSSTFIFCQSTSKYLENAEQLKLNLIEYNDSNFDLDLLDKIILNISINEENENRNLFFPSDSIETKILYNFVNNLFMHCTQDYYAILKYFELDMLPLRNVEFSEILSFDFYPVILNNPQNFILAYSFMNDEMQKMAIRQIDWLYEVDKIKEFRNKISKIKDENYQQYISDFLKYSAKYK